MTSLDTSRPARAMSHNQLGTPYRSFYAGLGYVAINTVTDWLFPDQPRAMAVVQCVYACALVAVVFLISRRFFSVGEALVAAGLVAFHPALSTTTRGSCIRSGSTR